MKTKLRKIMASVLSAVIITTTILSAFAVPAAAASAEGNPELSRRAASEGMILLENRGDVLPVAEGSTVAMFGRAMIDYTRGGGGSGNTNVDYTINILQGMQQYEQEGKVTLVPELVSFYTEQVTTNGIKDDANITVTDEVWSAATAATETAIVTIGRYTAEGTDRQAVKGDYYLSDAETELITKVAAEFENTVIILNIGSVMDTSWIKGDNAIEGIDAVLIGWQGGMEGGAATADVLMGTVNPSGKTVDTWAKDYADYPSSETFNESSNYVNYTEDIFVGYRYFETIPTAYDKVNYEFGYGLSYTDFDTVIDSVEVTDGEIVTTATVTNTGDVAGKEVVQVYFSAPRGDLTKPAKELAAFDKTDLLSPGASQTLTLSFPITDMSSYDDTGIIQKSAYVMESGDYKIFVGNSVRDGKYADFIYTVDKDIVTEQLSELCAPLQLPERMLEDGSFVDVDHYFTVSEDGTTRIEMENYSTATSTIAVESFSDGKFYTGKCLAKFNTIGDYVEYSLDVEKAGQYAVRFSYANGYTAKSDIIDVTVDGVAQINDRFDIQATSAGDTVSKWYNFSLSQNYIYVNLNEGKNIVRITARVALQPNFDYMILERVGDISTAYTRTVSADSVTTFEAESYDEGIQGKDKWGVRTASKDGVGSWVEAMASHGNTVKYNLNVTKAGQYKLILNGTSGTSALTFTTLVKVTSPESEQIFRKTLSVSGSTWYTFNDFEPIYINLPLGNCELYVSAQINKFPNLNRLSLEYVGKTTDRTVDLSTTEAVTIEAEDYVSLGWSSSGYPPVEETSSVDSNIVCVAHLSHTGNYASWWVNAKKAGKYSVVMNYANGNTSVAFEPIATVNGKQQPVSLTLPVTSVDGNKWYSFKDSDPFTIELDEGLNVFTLECTGDNKFPNLNTLTFSYMGSEAEAAATVSTDTDEKIMLIDVYNDPALMDDFLDQLTIDELAQLLSAQETRDGSTTWGMGKNKDYGVPLIMTADGPQGIRINKNCTAWPISTCLAASWDTDLVAAVSKAVATEAHNNNMDIWLAPGMNIHRDPLCGRNFEYYSEDPLLTGKLASTITTAVQAEGVAVSLKHFAANNKEENRKNLDSRLSERALREIYLRAFEIAVKEADPWTIMSSYNLINGVQNGENKQLLTGILRNEWGYNNVIETDWQNNTDHLYEILAGNDVKMTNSQPERLASAVEAGVLTREQLEVGAERVLNLVMKVNYFKDRMVNTPVVQITNNGKLKAAENIMWSEIAYSQTTADTDGGNHLAYCNVGAYTEYEINIQKSGNYLLSARIASLNGTGSFDMLIDDNKVATFNATNTGGYDIWTTVSTADNKAVALTEGRHTLTLKWTESGSNLNWIGFTLEPPAVIQAENTAQLTADARRVYWGYIGTENTEYKWFNDFMAQCGDTFTSEYAPKANDTYELTRKGFYRFVVNEDGKDYVYTVECTVDSAPAVDMSAENAVATLSGNARKVYFGYIGEVNTAYAGFAPFKEICGDSFTADFSPKDSKAYRMEKEGYYRFVVNYLDQNGKSHDKVFTFKCENAGYGIPDVTFADGKITLNSNEAKVNKMYIGYFGEETEVSDWEGFVANAKARACVLTPTDNYETELKNEGCYVILVNYTDENGKNKDKYFTFNN